MPQPPLVLIGLMSGTSLDGISAAVVRFSETETRINAELLAFDQLDYSAEQRQRLMGAMQGGTAQEYCRLHVDLGSWLADAAARALLHTSVARSDIAGVASHGHTFWHEPGHSTWQLGDASTIAERLRCPVISDFRSRDVAASGQGAPLVSMADVTMFADEHHWRALQNIGGIGNVTVVPPSSLRNAIEGVRAFDTGPGVVLIDAVVRHFNPSMSCDLDGLLAQAGTVHNDIVDALLAHEYFRAEPPKSTGRELFTPVFVQQFIAQCAANGASANDTIATATSFTARSIANQYQRFIPEPIADVVLSGGGARNPALVDMLRAAVAPLPVRQFSDLFFDGEAKEAVAFALLGYLHLTGRAGNVPRATGARGSRQLGVLTPA